MTVLLDRPAHAPVQAPPAARAPGAPAVQAPPQFRQGDVMLTAAALPESGLAPAAPEGGEYALMPPGRGRAEGSHRVAAAAGVKGYSLPGSVSVDFLVLEGFAWLRHHEHAPLLLSPGTWRVRRQREHVATGADVLVVRAAAD